MYIPSKILLALTVNINMSLCSFFTTLYLISQLKGIFLRYNLCGIDLNKKSGKKIPEALGVISGSVFLFTMLILLLLIPNLAKDVLVEEAGFSDNMFIEFFVALFCILAMVLLGFFDDVYDLRWRYKVFLPLIASIPLLMVYYQHSNSTWIIIPKPLRPLIGFSVDIGMFYYLYMEMLAIFCTNAINILAGINGLEVGQSVIIALSITVFNIIELSGNMWKTHMFSIYFMIPYIATSLGLLWHNWFPSKVFVGDTFCYFSGMTFAAVGILGHFSKTVLLFFIPQILNFVYSAPQIFHLVPCPRHRLPKYNPDTDMLQPSIFTFREADLNPLGKFAIRIFKMFKIIDWKEDKTGIITCNNFTLINFVLIKSGRSMKEPWLTMLMLFIQVLGSLLAFAIRYPLAHLFYDV